MRIISCTFCKHTCFTQGTIHLIGRYMIKTFGSIVAFPKFPRSIQQVHRTNHVGHDKCGRVSDRPVHMRFGSQMDHCIKLFFLKQPIDLGRISNIGLNKTVVRLIFYIRQIGQVTCISQFIKVHNLILWVTVYKPPHNMRANKTCTPGY
ncbi:hypothetical protein D3C87_1409400 [compost metagenome]